MIYINKKYLATTVASALLINNLLPIYQVQAKENPDIWPFGNGIEKQYVSNYYDNWSSIGKNIFASYSGNIIPKEFSVPMTNIDGENLTTVAANLNNKSIQYVSFVEMKYLESLGYYKYWSTSSGSWYTLTMPSFKNNEIRKIYWNSDDFYEKEITIWDYFFQNNKIQSLDLPNKIISIKQYAFDNNEISWMNWDSVKEIGIASFQNNKLVSNLPNGYKFKIPKELSVLPTQSFYNNSLTHIDIPENILSVEAAAFGSNPVNSIYFENPNTVINANFLNFYDAYAVGSRYTKKPDNYQDIIIYGHGENSTAAKFAANFGCKYVNVDQYENAVFDAEESFTEQKLNEAYEKINAMEDGDMKDGYLERLDNLNSSFEIAKYVEKAEQTLNKQDYQFAKARVSEMSDGIPRNNMNNRLDLVLKAINGARLAEIQALINGGSISLNELNDLQNELTNIGGIDASELKNKLEAERYAAEVENYQIALSYISHAKDYQTLKNVTNAQKIINAFSEDFKLMEDVTMTYNEPYLKDTDGNYLIDEEASYKKETVTNTDPDTGVSTSSESFVVDALGNKLLKDGLIRPIYVNDPLYGTTYVAQQENGNKTYLQEKLDEFADIVYAKSAIEIAEKYLSQDKLEDALILVLSLPDSAEKTELRAKIETVQTEIDNLVPFEEEINDMIHEFSITGSEDLYNDIVTKVNSNTNNEIKKKYIKFLKNASYKLKLNKVLEKAKKDGFTEETKDQAIIYLALIGESDDKYNDYLNEITELVKEYENYDQQYLDLMKEINFIDRDNVDNLTIDKYNEMKEKVFKVKSNNPNKSELISEISKLFDSLQKLNSVSYSYDLLKEELQFMKSNFKNVTTDELKLAASKITQIENKEMRNNLKEQFDDTVKTIIEDHLLPEYQKPENFTPDFKDDILSYVYLVNDAALKNNLKSKLEQKIYDIIVGDILINMDGPDIIRDHVDEGFKVNFGDMMDMLEDVALKDTVNQLVDDKIIDQIQNNYTDGSGNPIPASDMSKEQLLLLGQMYQAISDLSKQLAQKDFVNNIATEYFQTSYPNITNEGAYTMNDYKDMSTLTPYFDGIHISNGGDTTELQQIIDNNISKSITSNPISNIEQTMQDIGAIINQDARAEMNNYLQDYISNAVNNIDLSKPTSLSTLTDLGDQIQNIDDSEMKMKLGDILSSYIEDNAKTIYDTATQNNMDSQMMQFLSDYLSQDEISKLYNMDHDNVIGNQSNNKPLTSTTVNKGNDGMNKLYEALENLQKIIDGLKQQSNVLQDSSINTIDGDSKGAGNYNYQVTSGSGYPTGGMMNDMLDELNINEELANNQMTIQQLQDQIEELQKDNEELFAENIIALKAAAKKDDADVKKQLEAYRDGNKTFNNVLIGLGASMWLLILLGLMYNANLNLRNKKRIEAIDEKLENHNEMFKNLEGKITNTDININVINEKIDKILESIEKK